MLLCYPCSHSVFNCSSIQRINTVLIDQPSLKYAAFSKHTLIVNKSIPYAYFVISIIYICAVFRNLTTKHTSDTYLRCVSQFNR